MPLSSNFSIFDGLLKKTVFFQFGNIISLVIMTLPQRSFDRYAPYYLLYATMRGYIFLMCSSSVILIVVM